MPPDTTAPATPTSILARLVATPRALLSVLAVWLLATLGVRPLLLPDEGRLRERRTRDVARRSARADPERPAVLPQAAADVLARQSSRCG